MADKLHTQDLYCEYCGNDLRIYNGLLRGRVWVHERSGMRYCVGTAAPYRPARPMVTRPVEYVVQLRVSFYYELWSTVRTYASLSAAQADCAQRPPIINYSPAQWRVLARQQRNG